MLGMPWQTPRKSVPLELLLKYLGLVSLAWQKSLWGAAFPHLFAFFLFLQTDVIHFQATFIFHLLSAAGDIPAPLLIFTHSHFFHFARVRSKNALTRNILLCLTLICLHRQEKLTIHGFFFCTKGLMWFEFSILISFSCDSIEWNRDIILQIGSEQQAWMWNTSQAGHWYLSELTRKSCPLSGVF